MKMNVKFEHCKVKEVTVRYVERNKDKLEQSHVIIVLENPDMYRGYIHINVDSTTKIISSIRCTGSGKLFCYITTGSVITVTGTVKHVLTYSNPEFGGPITEFVINASKIVMES